MRKRRWWFAGLTLALVSTAIPSLRTAEDDRAATLSKARHAMNLARGDALPPDGQDSSPEFYPQGRADIRYVVVEGDEGGKNPTVCLIAQAYDGRRVRRLWKLPTRRVRAGDKPISGSLSKAMFEKGYVPAREPNPSIARALSRRVGLAGYYVSGPGSGAYSWFVDASGKVSEKHRIELVTNSPYSAAILYAITPEERVALGWRKK